MVKNIENTRNYQIGKKWEEDSSKLIISFDLTTKDNSHKFIEPDLIVTNKHGYEIYVECKKFNHHEFDVHKLSVPHYCKYNHRSKTRKVYYFFWHPEGDHEFFLMEEITSQITNFKDPQHWNGQFFYHFPRGKGMGYDIFLKRFSKNLNPMEG